MLILPNKDNKSEKYQLSGKSVSMPDKISFNRIAYSAAHVVADPFFEGDICSQSAIDWDKTLKYRRYLAQCGLGIAEAMDTAQRGMGLNWLEALELMKQTKKALSDQPNAFMAAGCGTDHITASDIRRLDDVYKAYSEQMQAIEKLDIRLILMASRALCQVAQSSDDYIKIYGKLLSQAQQPVILHWLGDMFDPALKGYWGEKNIDEAMDICLQIINENAEKVDGIKISLLDKRYEIDMRNRLPKGVKMYTGDDFNYPELIAGDDYGFSHALLGIFDAIAPISAHSLNALAKGDKQRYFEIFEPTISLSRHLFQAPTQYYKTGIVFLAYLNGFQDHFIMLGGYQSARPLCYFTELFKYADQAGLLRNPEVALLRMKNFLNLYGWKG